MPKYAKIKKSTNVIEMVEKEEKGEKEGENVESDGEWSSTYLNISAINFKQSE